MGLLNIFETSGSAISAQSARLNTTASNMANANVVAGSEAQAYRARQPVFATYLNDAGQVGGVEVVDIVESQVQIDRQYMPEHPEADGDGYIYHSNVNMVEEMANMMSSSRSYQSNVEVMNTAKQLMLRLLRLGGQ